MEEEIFQKGDLVVIAKKGHGTSSEDIGLICKKEPNENGIYGRACKLYQPENNYNLEDYNMVDYSKLKVGDRVKLTSKRPRNWNSDGKMDCYLNSVQTITRIYITGDSEQLKETIPVEFIDAGSWSYTLGDIVFVYPEENPKGLIQLDDIIINNYQIY